MVLAMPTSNAVSRSHDGIIAVVRLHHFTTPARLAEILAAGAIDTTWPSELSLTWPWPRVAGLPTRASYTKGACVAIKRAGSSPTPDTVSRVHRRGDSVLMAAGGKQPQAAVPSRCRCRVRSP